MLHAVQVRINQRLTEVPENLLPFIFHAGERTPATITVTNCWLLRNKSLSGCPELRKRFLFYRADVSAAPARLLKKRSTTLTYEYLAVLEDDFKEMNYLLNWFLYKTKFSWSRFFFRNYIWRQCSIFFKKHTLGFNSFFHSPLFSSKAEASIRYKLTIGEGTLPKTELFPNMKSV